MKKIGWAGMAAVLMLVLGLHAQAQKKPRKGSAKSNAASKVTVPPLDVRVAREKVSNQLANVNRFVDLLGPIAQQIEDADAAGGLSGAAAERNDANKQKVIGAIRNLRAGLTDLESDFRVKPDLQKYRASIEGLTDLAAQAEDSAIAGHFVAAKEPLRTAAQKLTDTLKVLPVGPAGTPY